MLTGADSGGRGEYNNICIINYLLVSPVGVDTATVDARIAVPIVVALVHVDVAVGPVEAGSAGAPVSVAQGGARGPVPTRLRRTIVRLIAIFS